MKKLISILLAVLLTVSLSSTAFACVPRDPAECWMERTIEVLNGPQLKRSGDTGTFDLGNGSSAFTLLTHTLKGLEHGGMKTLVFLVNGNSYEADTKDLLEAFADQPSLTAKASDGKIDLLTDKGAVVTTLEAAA